MASHQLIDAYLALLARRLPTNDVEELADGLAEAFDQHLALGLAPDAAAAATLAEFGDAATVLAAYTENSPWRRAARALLVSGPVVGGCWAAALIAGRAWAWPAPAMLRLMPALGLVLLAAVGVLAVAATGDRCRHVRLTMAAGITLMTLDAGAVTAWLVLAPLFVWPILLAAAASITRLALTARTMSRLPTR